ncbi:sugar ABC transporter ATP-binding protein [Micromonospora sp. NPDC048830]|uniref:sugar ABC transporter ATP-binding protein n=1 Tax=Micromonospora sp. NPDC048830 TaxID=3364257 RepID=UPI0037144FEC
MAMKGGPGEYDPGPATLYVEAVTKRYGATQALADGALTVRRGSSHALVGRNGAGKSTLVSIVSGLESADSGIVRIDGEPVPPVADRNAWKSLVSCVYQRPSVVPGASVAENLFLNEQPTTRFGAIDWKRMRRQAREELERWDIRIPVDTDVADLGLEQRRIIEIARALKRRTPLLILDEPTAELEGPEIKRLLSVLNQLRESGLTFLYISHHLAEMYEVCDDVTILRNGRTVAAGALSSFAEHQVIEAMVGEDSAAPTARLGAAGESSPILLDVRALTWQRDLPGVDLQLREGEILGVAGQAGAGGFELAQSLAGLRPVVSGNVALRGVALPFGRVDAAIKAGIGFVPQDRHRSGFVAGMSVAENLTLSVLPALGPAGFVGRARQRRLAAELVNSCGVVTSDLQTPVKALSGGNQQKVVVGRALASDPDVLVLERPTQGVDVASRDALMHRVEQFVADGRAAIVVSDEIDELRYCDRVLVIVQNRFTAEFTSGWEDSELVAAIEGLSQQNTHVENPS